MISKGQIPLEIHETLKLVEITTPFGQNFNNLLQKFVADMFSKPLDPRVSKYREVLQYDTNKPVRFILSCVDVDNAWYLRNSNPTTIILSQKLFQGSDALVKTDADLMALLSHEFVHAQINTLFGNSNNSKIEEGLAYTFPMDILFANGKNPEHIQSLYKRLLKNVKTTFDGLVDNHPLPDTINTITEDYLAFLRREKGQFPQNLNIPLKDILPDLYQPAKHISWVQSHLNQADFDNLDNMGKIGVIKSMLQVINPVLPVRIRDLRNVIQTLSLNEQETDILADECLLFLANHGETFGGGLYASVTRYKPLGRLKAISEPTKELIASTSLLEAHNAACKMVKAVANEPLFKSNKYFLQQLDWPQFEYPDLDSRKKKKISWQRLRVYAKQDKMVLRAAFLMGLGQDPYLHLCLRKHPKLLLKIYSIPSEGFNQFDCFSRGPMDGSSTLDAFYANNSGVIESVDIHESKDSKNVKIRGRIAVKSLLANAENDFLKAKTSEDAENRLLQAVRIVDRLMPKTKRELIGLSNFEQNVKLFLSVNDTILMTNHRCVVEFVNRLGVLLDMHPKNVDLVREVYYSPQISTYVSEKHRDNHGILTANPFFLFLVDNQHKLGKELTMKCLEKGINFYDVVYYTDANQAGFVLKALNKIDPENPALLAKTWRELAELSKTITAPKLEHYFIVLNAMNLINNGVFPSYDDIISVLEANKVPFINESSELTNMLRNHLNRRIIDNMHTKDISVAVKDWKLLSSSDMLLPKAEHDMLTALYERIKPELAASLLEVKVNDPVIRQGLMEMVSKFIIDSNGKDDGTSSYCRTLKQFIGGLNISREYRPVLYDKIAKKIEAQRAVAYMLEDMAYEIKKSDWEKTPLAGIFGEGTVQLIRKRPDARRAVLEFLLKPYTIASANAVIKDLESELNSDGDNYTPFWMQKDEESQHKKVDLRVRIKTLYDNFWAASLEIRALIAKELIAPEGDLQACFDYVIGKMLKKGEAYLECYFRAYIDSLPEYQKHLALAAMMVATQRRRKTADLGEMLAVLLEIGPAEIKCGQAGESHLGVSDNLRPALKRLKFNADEPNRWDVFHLIDSIQGDLEANYGSKLGRTGRVCGSASLFIIVHQTMKDGQTYALALLRPYGKERANNGFNVLRSMVNKLGTEDNVGKVISELIEDANSRLDVETDTFMAKPQYLAGCEMYKDLSLPGFEVLVPACPVAGDGYFLMTLMPGVPFITLPEDEHKKKVAKAILTGELRNLLRGRFDSDRHGGNVLVDGTKISHIDLKALKLTEWSIEDLKQVSQLLLTVMPKCNDASNFADLVLTEQKKMHTEGQVIMPLTLEVQKALLSLGDYARYLNGEEIQDALFTAAVQAQDSPFLALLS